MSSCKVLKTGSEGQFGGKENNKKKSQVTGVHLSWLKAKKIIIKLLLPHKTQNYIEKKLSKMFLCNKKEKEMSKRPLPNSSE